jgi:hypothetical protein
LCKPAFEYLPLTGLDISASLSISRRIDHPLKEMGHGFRVLDQLPPVDRNRELRADLDRMALYCLGVDDYAAGRRMRKSLEVFAQERIFVQRSLLAKYDEDSAADPKPDGNITTLTHITAVIFSLMCVIPLPDAPFHKLVRQVKAHFAYHDFEHEWREAPEMMTWILFLTGIAAIGMPERKWMVSTLDRCLHRLQIRDWKELKGILLKFLWLPITNDDDGEGLYDEIRRSNPFEDLKSSGALRVTEVSDEVEEVSVT